MADSDYWGPLDPVSDSLSPLPDGHRNGLIAVAVCGVISFISTLTIFLYLTYKLITWHIQTPRGAGSVNQTPANDLSLGLAQRNYGLTKRAIPQSHEIDTQRQGRPTRGPPNQFLILVYNLFFADIHQALAFLLNITWIRNNAITVRDATCWAQGWFVSTGDLSVSCFICAIAIHTYCAVVRNYKPPHWVLYLGITWLWLCVYALAIAGVVATNNGKGVGGFYVRAAAWCWVSVSFEGLRLWLHYFWIFLSLLLTSALYLLTFLAIRKGDAFPQPLSDSRPMPSTRSSANLPSTRARNIGKNSGRHPAFLIYPIISVLCMAPLALGRVVTMSGKEVSIAYFCVAGAMIASNGWLDVLLFSTTRRSIIFDASPDSEDLGIETFAFIRTPHWRQYGNMVWVQGGSRGEDGRQRRTRRRAVWGLDRLGQLMGWVGRDGRSKIGGQGSVSQESLRGTTGAAETGIQMDTVTTVVVEIEQDNVKRSREPSAHSIDSTEKDLAHRAGSLRL